MRIATLLPSATEMVCALGLEDHIVGRSHECDYPPSVLKLPVLTEPKLDTQGSSREIDDRVKQIVGQSLSVYRVDTERLKSLEPDVIVTQSQCEVCAVSIKEVEAALSQWIGARPTVVSLAPSALGDIWNDIERLASVIRVGTQGVELTGRLKARIALVAERAQGASERPAVACVEWLDPLMAAGNWMPELVDLAGSINLFGQAAKHSARMEFEELAAKDPAVILIAPCGFGLERSVAELPALAGQPGWSRLRAVRSGCVFVADGNHYFNRPGPRIVDSLEILAEILHPELFSPIHEGTGWRRVKQESLAL